MTAGGGGSRAVAGGPALHIPVLGRPALELLNLRVGGVYVDATFGAGGYSRAMLAAADCTVVAIDRDPAAIALGRELVQAASGRLTLVEDRFSNLDRVAQAAGYAAVDGVVLDLGVSSMQLDRPERGFSFRQDGPLDMRMGGAGPSAADVVNAASERDLANIVFLLGEEGADRDDGRARRNRRIGGALAPRRHPSGHAHVPGLAHLHQ
jgi:16S rRNA (cytosine1402-N4)-methyltransferase